MIGCSEKKTNAYFPVRQTTVGSSQKNSRLMRSCSIYIYSISEIAHYVYISRENQMMITRW